MLSTNILSGGLRDPYCTCENSTSTTRKSVTFKNFSFFQLTSSEGMKRVRVMASNEINQINWSYCSQRATHTWTSPTSSSSTRYFHPLSTSIFDLRFSCNEYLTVLLSIPPYMVQLISFATFYASGQTGSLDYAKFGPFPLNVCFFLFSDFTRWPFTCCLTSALTWPHCIIFCDAIAVV